MILPWVRLDTNFPDNPKILRLIKNSGKGSGFTYLCSLAYSGRHQTDGLIPEAALPSIHATKRDIKAIVEAGLWVKTDDGFLIPDWAEYQPTKATIEARSKINRENIKRRYSKGGN